MTLPTQDRERVRPLSVAQIVAEASSETAPDASTRMRRASPSSVIATVFLDDCVCLVFMRGLRFV